MMWLCCLVFHRRTMRERAAELGTGQYLRRIRMGPNCLHKTHKIPSAISFKSWWSFAVQHRRQLRCRSNCLQPKNHKRSNQRQPGGVFSPLSLSRSRELRGGVSFTSTWLGRLGKPQSPAAGGEENWAGVLWWQVDSPGRERTQPSSYVNEAGVECYFDRGMPPFAELFRSAFAHQEPLGAEWHANKTLTFRWTRALWLTKKKKKKKRWQQWHQWEKADWCCFTDNTKTKAGRRGAALPPARYSKARITKPPE